MEDFTLVLGSKKKKTFSRSGIRTTKLTEATLRCALDQSTDPSLNEEKILEEIRRSREAVENSEYFFKISSCLTILHLQSVVCYGLGNFSFITNSRYQLCLLLALKERLNLSEIIVYDPVFTESEISVLRSFGFEVQAQNDQCCYEVKHKKVLFFMVHCGAAMYNNVLWSNFSFDSVSNCVILGNSFSSLLEISALNSDVRHDSNVVEALSPFVTEVALEPNKNAEDCLAFTGTCLHFFDVAKIPVAGDGFWTKRPSKPNYKDFSSIILGASS